MLKQSFLIILFYFIWKTLLLAQDSDYINHITSKQYWIDYNFAYSYNNNQKLYGDAGYRNINTNSWDRYNVRVGYKINPKKLQRLNQKSFVEFHFGVGTFFTNNHNSNNNLELRPFQGIKTKWPILNHQEFTHYLRLEERIEHIVGDNYWKLNARLRYKIRDNIHFKGKYISKFYMPLSAEFFINLPKGVQFNDVVRITAGIGTRPKYNYAFELNTSWHNSKDQITGVVSTDDFVIRLRFFHYFQQ